MAPEMVNAAGTLLNGGVTTRELAQNLGVAISTLYR
jgi:hypothetical protein